MRYNLADIFQSDGINKAWAALSILFLTLITLNNFMFLSMLSAYNAQLQDKLPVHVPSIIAIGAIYSGGLFVLGAGAALSVMKNKLTNNITENLTRTRNYSLIFIICYLPLCPRGISGSFSELVMNIAIVSFFISFVIRYEILKKKILVPEKAS